LLELGIVTFTEIAKVSPKSGRRRSFLADPVVTQYDRLLAS